MTEEKTSIKYIDTHNRINTELRSFLNRTQHEYNSMKQVDEPHLSINALCNISIIALDKYLSVCNTETDFMVLLTGLVEEYHALLDKTDYVYEYFEGGDSHE